MSGACAGGIVAACSVPQPPVLLPGMTGRPVAEVEQLRAACLVALGAVLDLRPDRIVLIGAVPASVRSSAAASAPASAPASASGAAEALSLRVGRALLAEVGCAVPVEAVPLDADTDSATCAELGRTFAARPGRLGLIVLADGSACRTLKAPGYLDERAVGFDAALLSALTTPDWPAIAGLDAALAAELLVSGRPGWQVLAGALADRAVDVAVRYAGDPFGVFYPVLDYRVRA